MRAPISAVISLFISLLNYPLVSTQSTGSTPSPPTNLPPVSPGVFSAQASILINATIDDVWNALLGFPSYPDWNPFVRSQVVTDSFLTPTSSQIPAENLRLIITSQIPPLSPPVNASSKGNPLESHITIENITHFQPELHRVAWKLAGSPDAVLSAERWSAVSEFVPDENKPEEKWTFYESREVYDGTLAGTVKTLEGEGLQEGFEAQGEALKRRVEGM